MSSDSHKNRRVVAVVAGVDLTGADSAQRGKVMVDDAELTSYVPFVSRENTEGLMAGILGRVLVEVLRTISDQWKVSVTLPAVVDRRKQISSSLDG